MYAIRSYYEKNGKGLSEKEHLVWRTLEAYPQDIDSLGRRTGLSVVDLHGLLLQLELHGLV